MIILLLNSFQYDDDTYNNSAKCYNENLCSINYNVPNSKWSFSNLQTYCKKQVTFRSIYTLCRFTICTENQWITLLKFTFATHK